MTRAVQRDRAEVLRGGSWVWLPFAALTASELDAAAGLLLVAMRGQR